VLPKCPCRNSIYTYCCRSPRVGLRISTKPLGRSLPYVCELSPLIYYTIALFNRNPHSHDVVPKDRPSLQTMSGCPSAYAFPFLETKVRNSSRLWVPSRTSEYHCQESGLIDRPVDLPLGRAGTGSDSASLSFDLACCVAKYGTMHDSFDRITHRLVYAMLIVVAIFAFE
jgi:hypothetical protein